MDNNNDDCLALLRHMGDWQRGFLDAVFSSQGVDTPNAEQCSAALKRMTSFVIQKHGGEIPPDGRMSCATVARAL